MRLSILSVLLLAAATAFAGEPMRLTPPRATDALPAPYAPPARGRGSASVQAAPDQILRIPFQPRSAGLDAMSEEHLAKQLPALVGAPLRVLVHATAPALASDGASSRDLAMALAHARAQAVRRWLLSHRVPPGRVAVDAAVGPEHVAELVLELPSRSRPSGKLAMVPRRR